MLLKFSYSIFGHESFCRKQFQFTCNYRTCTNSCGTFFQLQNQWRAIISGSTVRCEHVFALCYTPIIVWVCYVTNRPYFSTAVQQYLSVNNVLGLLRMHAELQCIKCFISMLCGKRCYKRTAEFFITHNLSDVHRIITFPNCTNTDV